MVGNQLIDPDPGGQPSSHSTYNRHKINIIDKYFFHTYLSYHFTEKVSRILLTELYVYIFSVYCNLSATLFPRKYLFNLFKDL